jgi:hypothetical protein
MVLLQRRLNGRNEVVQVAEGVAHQPGVMKFSDFLGQVRMQSGEGLLELSQVLKVPFEDIMRLVPGGLIEGPAMENIREYVDECRICGASLKFLGRQSGDAGIKNKPESGFEDFKDNCG